MSDQLPVIQPALTQTLKLLILGIFRGVWNKRADDAAPIWRLWVLSHIKHVKFEI